MSKDRTLAASTTWLGSREAESAELARTPDEQVTIYFRDHAEPLFRYLAGVYGSEEDAEEVTQEAFLRLYEALAAGERIESPRAWVFTVARRLMLNCVKRDQYETRKREKLARSLTTELPASPFITPEQALNSRSKRDALRTAIRSMPTIEQKCLFARAQGLKLREIADYAGMDLRRVAEVIARAVERLQRQIRV